MSRKSKPENLAKYRRAADLVDNKGFKQKAVASLWNESPAAISYYVKRGRLLIREDLQDKSLEELMQLAQEKEENK